MPDIKERETKDYVIVLKDHENPDLLPRLRKKFSEAGMQIVDSEEHGLVVTSAAGEEEILALLHGEGFVLHCNPLN